MSRLYDSLTHAENVSIAKIRNSLKSATRNDHADVLARNREADRLLRRLTDHVAVDDRMVLCVAGVDGSEDARLCAEALSRAVARQLGKCGLFNLSSRRLIWKSDKETPKLGSKKFPKSMRDVGDGLSVWPHSSAKDRRVSAMTNTLSANVLRGYSGARICSLDGLKHSRGRLPLLRKTDGLVIVCRKDSAEAQKLNAVGNYMKKKGVRVVGIVINHLAMNVRHPQ